MSRLSVQQAAGSSTSLKKRMFITLTKSLFAAIWFRIVLVFAMALPMLVLYAISTLGPFLGRELRFEAGLLGYLVMSAFGIAAILSLWAGAFVNRIGTRRALAVLFFAVALAFALIATVEDYYSLV